MSVALPQLLLSRGRWDGSTALRTAHGWTQTHGELEDASQRLARQLIAAGVGVGDRVVFQVHKSPAVVVLHLALLSCGAIQVPVNPDYAESEVQRFLDDTDPVIVIRDPACPDVPGPWTSLTLDASGHGSLLALEQSTRALPTLTPDAGAAILFTSGTTGRPKGALLTHANLAHNASTLMDAWGFTEADHLVHVLPLFHTHGLFVAVHCVLASGASMTVLPRFDADQVIRVLSSDPPCTVMMGVPTHYSRLLDAPILDSNVTRHMRLFVSGSAPMPVSLHEAFADRTGHRVLERYGMTETSMLASNPLHGVRKPGSVGTSLDGVEVRVVDDAGDELTDEIGSVHVTGPNVFGGYWRRPDLHDDVFTDDGWFRTGDLGRFDADGYLHLVGRSKDLVISGGLNVYPADVEAVLDGLPGVRESAVVGVPDQDLGERVVAAVVVDPASNLDAGRVRSLARDHLAGYQVPKTVVVVAKLPRNAMGKVEKAALRQTLERAS